MKGLNLLSNECAEVDAFPSVLPKKWVGAQERYFKLLVFFFCVIFLTVSYHSVCKRAHKYFLRALILLFAPAVDIFIQVSVVGV